MASTQSRPLFTYGNPKTEKGESYGYLTAVLHLSPEKSAGVQVNGQTANVCPFASPGCIATCLNTAGRGGILKAGETTNAIQEARKRKTVAFFADREGFLVSLRREIAATVRKAARQGLKPAIRLNGTSDLPVLPLTLAREFPSVQFYDYSKVPSTLRSAAAGMLPGNYHLTFSQSETNAQVVLEAVASHRHPALAVNVAVVFDVKRGQPLPATYLGRPVIDGDAHDLRFLDERGVIVGLRAKGKAKRDCSGFVVRGVAS